MGHPVLVFPLFPLTNKLHMDNFSTLTGNNSTELVGYKSVVRSLSCFACSGGKGVSTHPAVRSRGTGLKRRGCHRGLPYMTSAKFSDFLTPSPLVRKFTQPPLLRLLTMSAFEAPRPQCGAPKWKPPETVLSDRDCPNQ